MNKPEAMPKRLEIVKIGDALGVILPRELLESLQLELGDSLSLTHTSDGISLSSGSSEFQQQMNEARSIMKRYRGALNELAK